MSLWTMKDPPPQVRSWAVPARILAIVSIAFGVWLAFSRAQIALAVTPPPPTTSYYVDTVDQGTLYQLGCNQSRADQTSGLTNGAAILDFGMPYVQNDPIFGPIYGVLLFNNAFADLGQVQTAAQQYGLGYYNCSLANQHIRIIIGTNNCGTNCGDTTSCHSGGFVTFEHGRHFATMVALVQGWISGRYSSTLSAFGGNDIEPCWNTAPITRDWVAGFVSVPETLYYDYGSCDSCPYNDLHLGGNCAEGSSASTPSNGWQLEDVWWVSWGASGALAFPEIYAVYCVHAEQWQNISLYGYLNHAGDRTLFDGALTQLGACMRVGCAKNLTNPPGDGWSQLFNAVNTDARTSQSSLPFSSDITWR